MSIKETLIKDRDTALKSGDQVRLSTLRLALGAIESAEMKSKKGRIELDDKATLEVLRSTTKVFREPAEEYAKKALRDGDTVMADKFKEEIERLNILTGYLPVLLTEEQTRVLVEKVINDGATNIGQVMGALKGRNDIDRKLVSSIAGSIFA